MNRRRGTNKQLAQLCSVSTPSSGHVYVPTKTDLFKELDKLRFSEPPAVLSARAAFQSATTARRNFERRNKRWRQLRRDERRAEKALGGIEIDERERWKDEIAECRTMLRLHGVTSAVVARIERLVYGEEGE